MKAVVFTEYGSPDVLNFKEVDKPQPADNEVLIKVFASSINSWDWELIRGTPFLNRIGGGLIKPKYTIPGADAAGIIEEVGKNVNIFKPGDEVFGDLSDSGWGACAGYVCAKEKSLSIKPERMTFEEAASIPQAGLLALQGLRWKGMVKRGQKILINGAGGGAGTFAVQIAKSCGAEVTGVDKSEKLEIMRSIGADHVIDYEKEDFTDSGNRYDLILDFYSTRSLFRYRNILNPNGKFVMVGGPTDRIFKTMFMGPVVSKRAGLKMGVLLYRANQGLKELSEMYNTGVIVPVIDSFFPLVKSSDAFHYFEKGIFKGKIVITIEHN
jgi:NADPH:quinone reductase-like Zn-dependent oxidoreductase